MALTYKQRFNKKYGFKSDASHSLSAIAKLTGYKLAGLRTIFNKGVGAFYTNPGSVRPAVKSPEQWAYARVYAAIDPKSRAHRIDKVHLQLA
jgi:hypothetical protein